MLASRAKRAFGRLDMFFKLTRNLEVLPEGLLRVSLKISALEPSGLAKSGLWGLLFIAGAMKFHAL
jgi:hypothetical protein